MTTKVIISLPVTAQRAIRISEASTAPGEHHEIHPGQTGEFNVHDFQSLIINEIDPDANGLVFLGMVDVAPAIGIDHAQPGAEATAVYPLGDGIGEPADTLIVVQPAEGGDEIQVAKSAESASAEGWADVVDNVGTPDAPAPGLGDHEANADAEAAAQKADAEAVE